MRDEVLQGYEQRASSLLRDPWAARDDYIEVILDRSEETLNGFFKRHGIKNDDRVTAVKLLELQRHAMLMYTSCGWFFDDISGIESVQVLQYAGRVVQLAGELFGSSPEEGFLRRLEAAKSNVREHGNGALIYEKSVRPSIVDLRKVSVHYAVSSLFEDYPEEADIYSYKVRRQDYRKSQAGRSQIVTGRCLITSEITGESEAVDFGVLHLGGQDFNCGVHHYTGEERYRTMTEELNDAFESGAFADVVRLMDTHFGIHTYSLRDLFKDEQRKILETLLRETMEDFENSYRRLYENNRILMGFLQETGIPTPRAFHTAAEFILNLDMKKQLETEADGEKIQNMLGEFQRWNASMNTVELEFTLKTTLDELMKGLLEAPSELPVLETVERMIEAAEALPFQPDLWMVQNTYYRMAKGVYREFEKKAAASEEAAAWVEKFKSIGWKLNFNLDKVLRQ